jgi:hypothetical protein
MRFKERRSDAFSVKDETKVAIGDEWQGQDSAVILLHIRDEFYTIAPSLLLHHSQERHFSEEQQIGLFSPLSGIE